MLAEWNNSRPVQAARLRFHCSKLVDAQDARPRAGVWAKMGVRKFAFMRRDLSITLEGLQRGQPSNRYLIVGIWRQ